MNSEEVTRYRNIAVRLRERSSRLRQQSFWITQQFSQVPGQRLPAEAVFEIGALQEENATITSLAAKLERRLREAGAAVYRAPARAG